MMNDSTESLVSAATYSDFNYDLVVSVFLLSCAFVILALEMFSYLLVLGMKTAKLAE